MSTVPDNLVMALCGVAAGAITGVVIALVTLSVYFAKKGFNKEFFDFIRK